jgi:hypothetical protein
MLFDGYYPLEADRPQPGPSAVRPTAEFLMRCLLGARKEAALPSNESGYDEDVNVYLVGLLTRFLTPDYHAEARRYLHTSDLDLSREASLTHDDRLRFRLYQTNADHLLLAIGLFRHVEGMHHPGNALTHHEPEQFIHRGGVYYLIASSNLRRLRRRPTAPEIAMRKLGDGFGDYVTILRRVRSSYFHLTESIGEGTLYHLSRRPPDPALVTISSQDLQGLYDGFLDAFSAWKHEPSPAALAAVRAAAQRLREADPDFTFALPEGSEN